MTTNPIQHIKDGKSKKEKYEEYLKLHDLERVISEMTNSVVHSQDPNPIAYMIKYLTGLLTEEERTEYGINIEPPFPQGVPIVKFPKYASDCILSKYLNKENWYDYKYLKTSYNNDINNLTHLGENCKKDKIGIALVDNNCLTTYTGLLEDIIFDVHHLEKKNKTCKELFKISKAINIPKNDIFFIDGIKDMTKYIKFYFCRNIEGYTFNNNNKKNYKLKEDIENEIINMKNDGVLPDDFKKVKNIEEFINSDNLISEEYKWMKNAGFVNNNYCMNDRSIWTNKDQTLTILINFSNHFEIISTCNNPEGTSLIDTFNYTIGILKQASVRFTFDVDKKYGYTTSNLNLLGGGFKLVGLFYISNIKEREDILKNCEFDFYEVKEDENLILISKNYLLNENNILYFIYKTFVELYGFSNLCKKSSKKLDINKIELKNKESPLTKAYNETFEELKCCLTMDGRNLNEFIEYYKLTENDQDFYFSSLYGYLIYDKFIYKYINFREGIDLELTNYMEKPEQPRSINNIESNDFINGIESFQIYVFRNISGLPFPLNSYFNYKNQNALNTIKKALEEINLKNKIGTFYNLSDAKSIIKNNNIIIFHNDNMTKNGFDIDYPNSRGFIKFEKQNLFATINDMNNINFILSFYHPSEKDDIKDGFQNLIGIVNQFSRKIKFQFDEKFGFFTACPKYFGNGMKICVDLKIKKLNDVEISEWCKGKEINYKEIGNKNGYRIIRLENNSSYKYSEIEMLCNWIYYINDIVLQDN